MSEIITMEVEEAEERFGITGAEKEAVDAMLREFAHPDVEGDARALERMRSGEGAWMGGRRLRQRGAGVE